MIESENRKVVWQVESTHPQLAEDLRTTLREVVDPELGLNIIELGLIREVVVEDDQAHLTMILTTPFCPYGPALMDMTRKKAESVLHCPTTVEMGLDMWDPSMMEDGAGADWGLY